MYGASQCIQSFFVTRIDPSIVDGISPTYNIMHGHKRAEYKARQKDPTVANALQKKALQWKELTANLAQMRNCTDWKSSRAVLTVTEKLLSVHPDPLHLYNQRREILQLSFENQGTLFDVQTERDMTTACLKRNPKAYGAWFHRKWCIRYFVQMTRNYKNDGEYHDVYKKVNEVLQEELELCSYFLTLDERNFHCWNYRRFVISCLLVLIHQGNGRNEDRVDMDVNGSWDLDCESIMGPQIVDVESKEDLDHSVMKLDDTKIQELVNTEWSFTCEKIESNFSNYSAFHYRSKLVPLVKVLKEDVSPLVFAKGELEIIHQAIFTEPDDQSAWWYYRFIISWLVSEVKSKAEYGPHLITLLEEEILSIEELVEEEGGNCKWGILALEMTRHQLSNVSDSDKSELKVISTQQLQYLIVSDKDRANRYLSMIESKNC